MVQPPGIARGEFMTEVLMAVPPWYFRYKWLNSGSHDPFGLLLRNITGPAPLPTVPVYPLPHHESGCEKAEQHISWFGSYFEPADAVVTMAF
jgi:hypothetical protein